MINNRGNNKRDAFGGDKSRFRNDRNASGKNRNISGASVPSSQVDQSAKPANADASKSGEGKKKKKKKKRKTNTLGLTPANDEYVDSEEEDDADEESRLAAAVANLDMMP
jgi:hypothetical protein